ncbi:hypothetical protein CYY_001282 [Polysphondylium violaceum]|uniref:DNA-3-methyladenine glycosylase I n=1 Tax=Polysphondylium violaceum TaxID=133409 RepID=A0A8J4PYG8_9MYCE|nr:hypothetical protein CYY_001282 [Polysphondylium violaceum]
MTTIIKTRRAAALLLSKQNTSTLTSTTTTTSTSTSITTLKTPKTKEKVHSSKPKSSQIAKSIRGESKKTTTTTTTTTAVNNINNNTTNNNSIDKNTKRCHWIENSKDQLYIDYHDNEWGKIEKDSVRLFENICLEGLQAGLSWITVLKKREEYRTCFYNFDPYQIVSKVNQSTIDNQLMKNPGLIRHRGKLEAIVANAKAFIAMKEKGEDFSTFLWSFVKNKQDNRSALPASDYQIVAKDQVSDLMSKELKKRNFKFVGSTTIYAFNQAVGIVNDHHPTCDFKHQ